MSEHFGIPHGFAVAETTRKKLLSMVGPLSQDARKPRKVTIVGAGMVGLAAAFSILNSGLVSEIALVDVSEDRVQGEAMDLMHGAAFLKKCTIRASSDYSVSENSNLVIITAGARQLEGETRLNLVGRNVTIFKQIIPKIVAASPNAIIVVASNPVDIMTYVTWKISGLPAGRVFGTGTSLDSSRFRTLCAEKLQIDSKSVHGYVIGEHGDSSVACWSLLNVGGVRLRDLNPQLGLENDPENWKEIHQEVINSAYKIIKAKGFTNWAIGVTCCHIAECVLRNEKHVIPVSIPMQGKYGIEHDIYLSLPAVVGSEGVSAVLTPILESFEIESLRKSSDSIFAVQSQLDL